MEEYKNIFKLVDKTLADNEMMLDYYREEVMKKDAEIEKLKEHISALESANRELSKRLEGANV